MSGKRIANTVFTHEKYESTYKGEKHNNGKGQKSPAFGTACSTVGIIEMQ